MRKPILKKPEGPVVWKSTDPEETVFVTREPDQLYYIWVHDPEMVQYGYTSGYAWRFNNTNKRDAIHRAERELASARAQDHHARKKSPAQLQREIEQMLAKPTKRHHATTQSGVPSALTHWEGSHSDVALHPKYRYAVDQGTYHITPVSNPDRPRDVRYDLRFNKKPLGWEKIGPYHKTLRKAVTAAQRHFAAL